MKHTMMIIWFVVFLISFINIFLSYLKREKIQFFKINFIFSVLVTLGALIRLVLLYYLIVVDFTNLPAIVFVFRAIVDSAILFGIIFVIHALVIIPFSKSKIIIFTIIALIYLPFPVINVLFNFRYQYVHKIIYFLVAAMSIYYLIVGLHKSKNARLKKIFKSITYIVSSAILILVLTHIIFAKEILKIHSFTYIIFIITWTISLIFYMRQYAFKECDFKLFSDEYKLTERETEIIKLVALGKTNSYISLTFDISIHTVKTHIQNISGKIGVSTKLEIMKKIHDFRNA